MNKENWPNLDAGISWQSGFLIDVEIQRAIANNHLIRNGNPDQAKYATYELRIGTRVEQLVMDDDGNPNRDIYTAKHIPEDGTFTIQPGETFKIYSAERLYMPANILALAVPVGNMYKLGLNPETTFADPGFEGDFYITVCNYSPRIVRLRIGDPLARVFFFKVRERPETIHESHPREMPPSVERVPRPSREELEATGEKAILTAVLGSVDPPHYQHAFVTNRLIGIQRQDIDASFNRMRRQLRVMRWVLIGVGAAVVIMLTVFAYRAFAGHWPSMAEGTISSLIASSIWFGGALAMKAISKWE